jgi:hypothetical protein
MDRGAAEATKLAAATARMREPLKVAELRVDRLRRTRQPLASLLDIAAGAIEMVHAAEAGRERDLDHRQVGVVERGRGPSPALS